MKVRGVVTAALAAGFVAATGVLARKLMPERPAPVVPERRRDVMEPEPGQNPPLPGEQRVRRESAWVETPSGRRHALVVRPAEGEGPFPALVILAGAGGHTAEIMLPWSKALAAHGIVCLTLDKSDSYGLVARFFDDLADDGAAAIAHLQGRDDVDRDRVSVAGLSEGAWVAVMAANRADHVAGVVKLSGPGVKPGEQPLWMAEDGLARTWLPTSAYRAVAHAVGMPIPGMAYARHDSPAAMAELQAPMLAVYGLEDRTQPIADGAHLVLASGERRSVLMLEGLGHTLDPDDMPAPQVVAAVAEFVQDPSSSWTGVRGAAPADVEPAVHLPQVPHWHMGLLLASTTAMLVGWRTSMRLAPVRRPGERQAYRLASASATTVAFNYLGVFGLVGVCMLDGGRLALVPWVALKGFALWHAWTTAEAVVASGGRPRSLRQAAGWLAALGAGTGTALTGATAEVW